MTCLHPLPLAAQVIPSPASFPDPFVGQAHPLCRAIVDEMAGIYLSLLQSLGETGKMFGVLVVEWEGKRGFLSAFSGTLGGQTCQPGFVPPVYDLMAPGCHFQEEQSAITALNNRVRECERQLAQRAHDASLLVNILEARCAAYERDVQDARSRRHQLRASLSADELVKMELELIRESQFMKAELRRLRKALESA
ncbi:MAG: RNA pseudouridine synthase, partial [Bacteroidaceae bacterium]|nr:RNA pseudouridine synthase [Bacteroidaceae bacterium]